MYLLYTEEFISEEENKNDKLIKFVVIRTSAILVVYICLYCKQVVNTDGLWRRFRLLWKQNLTRPHNYKRKQITV